MKTLIIQPMMSFTREKWSIRFQGRHDDDGYIDKCIYGGYIESQKLSNPRLLDVREIVGGGVCGCK